MNDIIDKWTGAYKEGTLDNYSEKVEPKSILSYFNSSNDIETNSTRSGSS
jgi:hypothetical protein